MIDMMNTVQTAVDSTKLLKVDTTTLLGKTIAQNPSGFVAKISNSSNIQDALNIMIDQCVNLGLKILAAIAIYIIARWIIKKLVRITRKALNTKKVEISLSHFLLNLLSVLLNFILIIAIIGVLGIDTSSLIALFASAGIAIGLALSGTLQNFAGGVMILFFKPFKVGDFIEAQGQLGTVKEIMLFNTFIKTVDNKIIIVPNNTISSGIIKNFSKEPTRRVDWEFGIGYGDDYDKAKDIILKLLQQHGKTLVDPAPFIALSSLGDSSVNIVVRAWVNAEDYWDLFFFMNEMVYKEFAKQGINIPFPQMDVHLIKEK